MKQDNNQESQDLSGSKVNSQGAAQEEDDEDYELDENEIVQTILALGNEIWRNFGQEEEIDDISVFFQHQFYIQCFQIAYPDFDFSGLLEGDEDDDDPQKMAECIQALIDLLAEEILMYDMNHIKGDAIVDGNPEHCINLLQILQQISSASMLQDGSGEGNSVDQAPPRDSDLTEGHQQKKSSARIKKSQSASRSQSAAGKHNQSESSDEQQFPDLKKNMMQNDSDNDLMELNHHLPPDKAPDMARDGRGLPHNGDQNLFGDLQGDDSDNEDKQQFLDNLDDDIEDMGADDGGMEIDGSDNDMISMPQSRVVDNNVVPGNQNNNRAMGVDKVGDVIGQELDIEFDEDIQDNIQIMQGRRTGGSSAPDMEGAEDEIEENSQSPMIEGQDMDDLDEDEEIIDHNDVNIIDDGVDFMDNDEQDDSDDSDRNLNRKTDNMANYSPKQTDNQHMQNQEDSYDDEIVNDQNSSNFKLINQGMDGDDEGLDQLHDQLKDLDNNNYNQEQIIDDQNLDMMHNMDDDHAVQVDENEDEGQHYPDDDDDIEDGQDMDDLEAHMQMAKDQDDQQDADEEEMNFNYDQIGDLGELDPELLEAAQNLGLDENGIRMLQQQMYQQAAEEGDQGEDPSQMMDYGEEHIGDQDHIQQNHPQEDDEDDMEGQEIAQMLNGDQQQSHSSREMQIHDQQELLPLNQSEDHQDASEDKMIVRGGQNIEDDQSPIDEDLQNLDQEMAEKLKQLNENDEAVGEDDEEGRDDDEDQYFDIDALTDDEKAILIQYLQEEYMKDPNSLPMPKEQFEQLLAENQELLQNAQQNEDGDDQGDEGEDYDEDDQNAINSNEIVVESNDDGAMIIQGEDNIDESQQEDQYLEDMEDNGEDDQDQQYQQYQMNNMLHAGEINIEGGEQNIIDEEADDQQEFHQFENEEDQQQYDEHQADEDEEEEDQQLIFNPQYQLDEIQEGDMIQNINVQNQQQQQQMQQIFYQQQMKPVKTKKKKSQVTNSRKPPLITHGGYIERNTSKPLSNAANKKYKRTKLAVNTISHNDDDRNQRYGGFEMMAYNPSKSMQRKTTSQKRPQTAKPRKAAGTKATKRYNNYLGTPSNRIRTKVGMQAASSTNNMMIPQQSQMFTSFGQPQGSSQRKAASNPKKRGIYSTVKSAGSLGLKAKKNRVSNTMGSAPKQSKQSKKSQIQQQQQQQQFLMQQQNIQNNDQQFPQNLVEMPILSEEFLNQLNEEQLQALLEQQQQLMMLQQANPQQSLNQDGGENQTQGLDMDQQQQLLQMQQDQMAAQSVAAEDQQQQIQLQQAALMQQQMQKNNIQGSNLRTRGRTKNINQAQTLPVAARIPSGGKASAVAGSASRSRHGSKKRTQKTRSSQNVGMALNSAGSLTNVNALGGSVTRSQKLAAQIYGNSGDNMLNSLITQRKKPAPLGKKSKKRSQPNQGLAQKNFNYQNAANLQYNQQAQINALKNQYNLMNNNQFQQQPENQYQMEMGPDGFMYPQFQNDQNQENEDQNNSENPNDNDQEIINEVSPDQEDGDSQLQQQMMDQRQMQQMPPGQQSNIMPQVQGVSNIADDLSTEQIIELLQNAADAQSEVGDNFDENGDPIPTNGQQLPQEVQIQLQQVLQERINQQQMQQQQQDFLLQQQQMVDSHGMRDMNQHGFQAIDNRVQANANIYNILTESVSKAKERYQHLAPGASQQSQGRMNSKSQSPENIRRIAGSIPGIGKADLAGLETDKRIMKQKQQFEQLLKQYKLDQRKQENKRIQDMKRAAKIAHRDDKIKAIKQKKFEEQMMNQQRSQMYKRNAQQVRLCKKVYKLASDLEKNKLLDEKKQYKEEEIAKQIQKKSMVNTIENYYKDKIAMLKDRIEVEKIERKVAEEAQKKALSQMKRELDDQKRQEVQRYIQLLQQEDDKYDLQNLNLGRLQHEIVKLYKQK